MKFLDQCSAPPARTPTIRANHYIPGTRKWAVQEAINQMDGEFRADDLEIGYRAVCRLSKIVPRAPERNIREVVSELVKRGILIRCGVYHSGILKHQT